MKKMLRRNVFLHLKGHFLIDAFFIVWMKTCFSNIVSIVFRIKTSHNLKSKFLKQLRQFLNILCD